jgi:hypothetical protein
VTRAEFSHLTQAALPLLLDAAAERCRGSLPASAFLLTGARAVSDRMRADADAHWAAAYPAFVKFGEMPKGLSEKTIRGLAEDMIRSELPKAIKSKDCGTISEAVELLSPLPPENLGRLTALLVSLATDEKDRKKGDVPLNICQAPA